MTEVRPLREPPYLSSAGLKHLPLRPLQAGRHNPSQANLRLFCLGLTTCFLLVLLVRSKTVEGGGEERTREPKGAISWTTKDATVEMAGISLFLEGPGEPTICILTRLLASLARCLLLTSRFKLALLRPTISRTPGYPRWWLIS